MNTEQQPHIKVFICYAKEDRKVVRQLYEDLKQAVLKPWIDYEDLLPGQCWETEINRAIDTTIICT